MRNKMSFALLRKFFLTTVLFLLLISNLFAQESSQWNPQKTWIFSVGLLEFKDSKTFVSFPKENRRDEVLLNVFRQKGVPENQIVFLKDRTATIAKIQNSFETLLRQTKPGDWVFVYYTGHGSKLDDGSVYLASYDADLEKNNGWAIKSIPDTIDRYFKGDRAIIALDTCYSGALADMVKNRRSKVSYAVLASTPSNSSSTGNWTFTESLIYAFRGDAYIDDDKDGKITFGEMIENSYADMLFAEEQVSQFALTGDFNNQVVLEAAEKDDSPRLGDRIEAFDGNDWYKALITHAQNGLYKVHYFGYEYEEDEYVSANEIRLAVTKQYKVGEAVQARSEGIWYAAHIVKVEGGAHLVSFDGYDEDANEWLPSSEIRQRNRRKSR